MRLHLLAFFSSALVLGAAALTACQPPDACASCSGCCNAAGQCESGTSNLACGSSGLACSACGTSQQCLTGACVALGSTGGGGGTGGGSGGGTGGVVYLTTPDGGQAVSVAAGDPCAGFPLLLAEYTPVIQDCPGEALNPGVLNEAQCRLRLPSCPTADRQQIDVMLNCFRRLEACTQQTLTTWRNRAGVCKGLAQSLSTGCRSAF